MNKYEDNFFWSFLEKIKNKSKVKNEYGHIALCVIIESENEKIPLRTMFLFRQYNPYRNNRILGESATALIEFVIPTKGQKAKSNAQKDAILLSFVLKNIIFWIRMTPNRKEK